MIDDDISAGNCHLADTHEFLSRLFPVSSSIVDDVYETLVKSKTYNPVQRTWKDLPKDSKKESLHYKPFVAAAESIRQAHTSRDDAAVSLSCMWINRHSRASKSRDNATSLIRPDVLCVLGMNNDERSQWEALTNDQDKENQLKAITAWWLQVNVAVEIKPADSDDLLKHIKQLLGYMRQVLKEQVDRRFVPGFLFSRTRLSMWVCDRSGVLGTAEALDIHENPKAFIQIILACSLLPPHRLGWDPTMRLCRYPIDPQNLELLHSYDSRITLADYRESLYHTHWVITMPGKDDPAIREEYITVRTLSAVTVESMSGCATTVWAVIKVVDLKAGRPPHKIYVLKQCWRPTAGTNEGEFFPKPTETDDIHVGRIHSFEDVLQGGVVVDTQNFARQSLVHSAPADRSHINVNGKRENEAFVTAKDHERYLEIVLANDRPDNIDSGDIPHPTWRTATRMLFLDYGWPLKYFRDLLELTRILGDIVAAHRWLYFKYGTLHRDISTGNALICPSRDSGTTEGRLIDLDYAKHVDDVVGPWLYQLKHDSTTVSSTGSLPSRSYEGSVTEAFGTKVSTEIVHLLRVTETNYLKYARALLDYKPSLQNQDIICGKDVGLLDEEEEIPDSCNAWPRTGSGVYALHHSNMFHPFNYGIMAQATLPFASAEILTGESMFVPAGSAHNAIHDLEALFWVFTSICLTREGPGGKRRKELEPGASSTGETQPLILINYCLFSSSRIHELVYNKKTLFQTDHYEEHVIPHFHPYFEPLKPLLLKWWKVLRLGYQYPIFEAVHEWFLDAIKDTMCELERAPPAIHPESEKVDEFRRLDLESLQYFPRKPIENETYEATWDSSPVVALGEKQGLANYRGSGPTSVSLSPMRQPNRPKKQRVQK